MPSLDVNQANVGTQCLQEVAHDNTLRECVGGWFPLSFSGALSVLLFLSLLSLQAKKKYFYFPPVHFELRLAFFFDFLSLTPG